MKFFKRIKSVFNNHKFNKKNLAVNFNNNFSNFNSYFYNIGKPVWMERNYEQFAVEGYSKNVIAYRAINMIASSSASISLKVFDYNGSPLERHPIIDLLYKPNPHQNKSELLENIYLSRLISGNAYLFSASDLNKLPREIYSLRPDRINVIAGDNCLPLGYQYKIGKNEQVFAVDQISGLSRILHIKNSNPLCDWYGLSAIEAAAYSIDQHNNAASWNQALLQNGARPSGAIIVKGADGRPSELTDEQFSRLKEMIEEDFTGAVNAGKPMILEGGLYWKEISLSPKDMDFIEGKHSAARDIALAFGVPPQLLGIPGDNTYSNLVESRTTLWEQTILPLAQNTIDHIRRWLAKLYKQEVILKLDSVNFHVKWTSNSH